MEKRKGPGNLSAVRLRPPEPNDALALMDFFNGLIEEGVQISRDRRLGYEEEVEWLRKELDEMARGEALIFVAEDEDGKMAGAVDIRRGKFKESHTAELGISVCKDYRKKGLGTELMRLALAEAKKIGIKLVWLQVFSTNKDAIGLYRKLGFKKEATLKKMLFYRGRYVDKIIMSLPLRR